MAGPYYLKSGNATEWTTSQTGTTGSPGTLVVPKRSGTGTAAMKHFVYECTTAGTGSATTEPTWPTTAGSTVTDGTIVWTCRDCTSWTYANIYLDYILNATAAAGDIIYASYQHAESIAGAVTYTFPGGTNNPNALLSSDQATGTPPTTLRAGASFTNTGSSSLTVLGGVYAFGGTFTTASGGSGANSFITAGSGGGSGAAWLVFENCAIVLATTGSTGTIQLGSTGSNPSRVRLVNTTVQFAATGQSIALRNGIVEWLDTPSAIQGATLPTTLFAVTGTNAGTLYARSVDLSALGSGKTLISYSATTPAQQTQRFERCKLGASISLVSNSGTSFSQCNVEFVNCTTGTAIVSYNGYLSGGYVATITTDTANYKTTGGSSLTSDGLNPYSYKLVCGGSSKPWFEPAASPWLVTFVETTGAHTLSVDVMYDSSVGTLFQNDVWLEVAYMGDAGDLLTTTYYGRQNVGSLSNYMTFLTNGTNSTALPSGASWTTSGITTVATATLTSGSVTVNQKGYVACRVCFGKQSRTVWVDANVTVT